MKGIIYKKNIAWRIRKYCDKKILFSNLETYEIDEIGEFIYKQIDGMRSVDDIANLISDNYDVTTEESKKDLIEFLASLEACKIIYKIGE